jgi:hypothetical protein
MYTNIPQKDLIQILNNTPEHNNTPENKKQKKINNNSSKDHPKPKQHATHRPPI